MGYSAEMQTMAGDVAVLTILGVQFSWKAGQHVLLWCPALMLGGPLDNHPFTISNISQGNRKDGSCKLELVLRAHSGLLHPKTVSTCDVLSGVAAADDWNKRIGILF